MNGKGDNYRPSPHFATNFKQVKQECDWGLRQYVREMMCLVDNGKCSAGVDPHHVRTRGAGGIDRANLVPLCRVHHTELHQIGRLTFEDKYRLGNLKVRASNIQDNYDSAH